MVSFYFTDVSYISNIILRIEIYIHWGPGIGTTDTEVDLGIRTRQSTDTGTPKPNFWGPGIHSKRGKVRIPRPAEGPGIRTILSVLSV